jgi:prevent-host-death family protein
MVMKRTTVAELKAPLSEDLAGVRTGDTVAVGDRSTPIARILPYDAIRRALQKTLDDRESEDALTRTLYR